MMLVGNKEHLIYDIYNHYKSNNLIFLINLLHQKHLAYSFLANKLIQDWQRCWAEQSNFDMFIFIVIIVGILLIALIIFLYLKEEYIFRHISIYY